MSNRKKQYDAKALFLEGLMAFGNFFSGRMGMEKTHTKASSPTFSWKRRER